MAQRYESNEPESVQERIETLTDRGERARELTEELQDIQQKREQAASKNNAFRDLKKKISEVREQYEQLKLWMKYASRMSVCIPENDIQSRKSDVKQDLQSVTAKTWDDFDNGSTVREVISSFENHRKSFRRFTTTVREAVQENVEQELESVGRTQTLLQVPDIGDTAAEKTCRNYQYFLDKLANGEPSDDVTPSKWESHHDEFHELEIDLGEGLGDDTKDVIWALLEEQTVTLAEIDEAVLDDLNTFEEFSKRLSVQFTTNP
jgi:hypothetical protein